MAGTQTDTTQGGGRRVVRSARSWGGYAWFMSFGTILPLPIFLGGYLAQLTFVGAVRFGGSAFVRIEPSMPSCRRFQ